MPAIPESNGATFTLVVSRECVETLDAEGVLAQIQEITQAAEGHLVRQRLALMIDGFNEDPLPLYTNRTFRHLAQLLLSQWPEWAYWLNPADPWMRVWLLAICEGSLEGDTYAVDLESLNRRLHEGLVEMNRLCEYSGVAMEVRVEMAKGVMSALVLGNA